MEVPTKDEGNFCVRRQPCLIDAREYVAYLTFSRCCPGVPDHVKANAKQITEGKATPKALKKQSDAVATKGTKVKMASVGMAMYQYQRPSNSRLLLRPDQGDQPHHCLILLFLQYSCAQCECCYIQGYGAGNQYAPPPPNNAAIDGELLGVVQFGFSTECRTSHTFGWALCSDGMTWLRRGLVNFVFQSAIFLKCVGVSGHMADGGTKDAEFIVEQALEVLVLEDSGLLGFNFKGHFGVIWVVGASNNSLAGGGNAREPA
jgi:hypothetical protein